MNQMIADVRPNMPAKAERAEPSPHLKFSGARYQHYYDAEHEPGAKDADAFLAVCGADMRTTGDGPKCPECVKHVERLNLPNDDIDGGVFDPSIFANRGA